MVNAPRCMTGFSSTATAICVVIASLACGDIAFAQPDSRAEPKLLFNPKKLMTPRRAIVNAPFLAADGVKDQVSDTELILGVVVEGHARAYPINMLTGPAREIINDRIGQTDFAATW